MSASNYQFIETYDMFMEYLGYPQDVSYEEWKRVDADDKAALLFVNFFEAVTQAWYNAVTQYKIVYVTQDDGVSTILQYLMKNVAKIDADENRYTYQYIYRVCYNCLASFCGTQGTARQRCSNEISNEYTDGDIIVNLWDLVPSEDEDIETKKTKEAIWNVIRHMGPKAEKVVNHLINPDETIHRISTSSSERPLDRLADVSVSKAEYAEIIDELRVKLAPFKDAILQF